MAIKATVSSSTEIKATVQGQSTIVPSAVNILPSQVLNQPTINSPSLFNPVLYTDLLPSPTDTINLGSSTKRFKEIFLSGSSIDLNGTKIQSDTPGKIKLPSGEVNIVTENDCPALRTQVNIRGNILLGHYS